MTALRLLARELNQDYGTAVCATRVEVWKRDSVETWMNMTEIAYGKLGGKNSEQCIIISRNLDNLMLTCPSRRCQSRGLFRKCG
jgi:hypothetical protein